MVVKSKFLSVGSPVCVDNKMYAAVSDDWTHPKDPGILVCIDATKIGDITRKGFVWQYRDIGLFDGTVSISKGLIYAADLNGRVHCIDKETGEALWVLQTKGGIRANAVVADGKVYVGTSRGEVCILKEGKTPEILHQTQFRGEINGACSVANGALFVTAHDTPYAIQQ